MFIITTFTIHHSFALPLQAKNLPVPQILTIDCSYPHQSDRLRKLTVFTISYVQLFCLSLLISFVLVFDVW